MKNRFSFISVIFTALILAAAPVLAQEDDFDLYNDGIIGAEEFSTGPQDEYIEPAFPALAKMYWAVGKLDISNDTHLDNYLMITECELYNQFYQNDFEWANLRDATRDYIRANLHEFPKKFEIVIPIALGRYDLDTNEFSIIEESKIEDLRKLDFSYTAPFQPFCGNKQEFAGFPRNIITIFNQPFTLNKVPVRPDIAQLYLDEMNRKYEGLSDKQKRISYERMAYLRFKITITKYKETVISLAGDLRAVVYATIDGVEIYADTRKMKPLYTMEVESERPRRLRRRAPNRQENE